MFSRKVSLYGEGPAAKSIQIRPKLGGGPVEASVLRRKGELLRGDDHHGSRVHDRITHDLPDGLARHKLNLSHD